ncbi:MAG: sigma-70 family RNA polymerase sigma factor [Gemmatimonadota bacterium]
MPVDPTDLPTVTRLLGEARLGNSAALDELIRTMYAEFHRIAERHMRGERPDHTLQPTALVNEALIRLLGGASLPFEDRTHFLRAASQAMRRVLVDHARARNAAKRGGPLCVTLDENIGGTAPPVIDMLVLDDALNRLAEAEPRWAQVVELRFFAGLEVTEIAQTLGVSTATIKRDWRFARAWLARELGEQPGETIDG